VLPAIVDGTSTKWIRKKIL